MRELRVWLVAGMLATALGLVGACQAGGSGSGVASAGDGGRTQGSRSASEQEQARQWAQCMRDHGVNVPDPNSDAGGGVSVGSSRKPDLPGPDDPTMKAAIEACKSFAPNGGAPPSMDPQRQEQARQWAQCMRDHGVDVPDPDSDGHIQRPSAAPLSDLNADPVFKAAQEACRDKQPSGGGR